MLINELDESLLLAASSDGNVRIWENFTQKGGQKLVTAFSSVQGHGAAGRSIVIDWQQQSGYLYASGDMSLPSWFGILTRNNFSAPFSHLLIVQFLPWGENGPISYTIDQIDDWDDYVKNKPLLVQISSPPTLYGKLFDPKRPYQITDTARIVLRSAALTIRNANLSGFSLMNHFIKGNVVVIKQNNFVAFRTLQLDPSREWGSNPSSGYNQMSMFMKDTIRETHNTSPSLLPLHMESYFQDLDAPNVDEDFIVDHPSTMTNMRPSSMQSSTSSYTSSFPLSYRNSS
ncbi:hypothetical protein PVAP13_5NG364481 [Panicum virgatum]|uniref:Uncharacterized protein n=1 Tax=Panicum virgatum TaxID=38727 RepID=A0A8T0RY60_PANVG|nr:hypothetical protein PVAP13_5NG364481 [Panicum virgatum]